MRTKTTLAAAAILAAGLASSMAQANVYSLNIVGYYNVPVASGGLTPLANSLKAGTPTDRADQVLPYNVGNNIQIWNGSSWDVWGMDDLSATGWINPAGADAPLATLPILGPGQGFFYGDSVGVTSITFVGEVRTGVNTVVIPSGVLTALGSPLPYNGAVSTGPLNLQVQIGDNIQKWNGSSWDVYGRDDLSATGWIAPSGADGPEPTLNIGQGFFYGNAVGALNWTQTLNP